MDNICIKVAKLRQLELIGKLVASNIENGGEYLRLAMYIEQYVRSGEVNELDQVKQQLGICIQGFPTFDRIRTELISELLKIGYLSHNAGNTTIDSPINSPLTTPIEITPPILTVVPTKSNVVQLFKNKKSDS
jgi:hypothetical protein